MSEEDAIQRLEMFKKCGKLGEDLSDSPSECEKVCAEKSSQGASKFQTAGNCLVTYDTKVHNKIFELIQCHALQNTRKQWSFNQDEFLILTDTEGDRFNQINCLPIASGLAFAKGDTTCLEEIYRIATHYLNHPGIECLMNNLGVMFSEHVLYKKSEECFDTAKRCFKGQQDHLKEAVVTLNLALLQRALGNYQRAQDLCCDAASLCHDISMRTTKEAHLPAMLLRRIADVLEEFGKFKTFYKILGICVRFDISGGSEAAEVGLTNHLMRIQLKTETGEKIQAEEVRDFVLNLSELLDKPAAALLNAEVMKTVIITAKIYSNIGHHEEAYNLLKKLGNAFLMVHGGKSSLYGSLLYQIGCFLLGSERFGEAESVLKQAEEILVCYFGRGHHAVASCKSSLGYCVLLKGNSKEALKYLNEGLAMFRKINPNHPEVGEIVLKLAFFCTKEGNFQCAHDTVQEAMDSLISACGEVSAKTAGGYFQSAMVLLKVEVFRSLAEEKLMKAIDIFFSLGLSPDHSNVMVCHTLLGVLQLSLGKYEEAKKCFKDVQQQVSLFCQLGIKARIPGPTVGLVSSLTAGHSEDRFSFLCVFVSLVNLVHMTTGDERHNHLYTLVSCLEEHKTKELQIWDFAGQDVFCVSHRVPISDKPVVYILHSDPRPIPSQSNEGLNSNSACDALESVDSSYMFLSAAVKNSLVLFLRVPHAVQEGVKSLASAFKTSINTLFLQPKFRKGFVEGTDFYMELTMPADSCDISSLCRQIDCLPLLIELELSESQEQCENFDYLTSWDSSMKSVKPSAHVFYFSLKCPTQREAEFVFALVIHSLGQKLALNKVQGVVVSNISPLQNVASFISQEPSYSSVSVVVENMLVIVKCCSLTQSDLNCVSFSVRNALESTVESLCDVVRVNFEQSAWLPCEDVVTGGCVKECSSGNCSLDVNSDPSCSGLVLQTRDLIPCASSRDPESVLKRNLMVDLLQDENAEVNPTVSHPGVNVHADVDVCQYLLSCLLRRCRPASPKEGASNSHAASVSGYDSDCSNIQVNQNHSVSSSLNSYPVTPSTFPEAGDLFPPKNSQHYTTEEELISSASLSSARKMSRHDQDSLAGQSDSEISMYEHLSSYEAVSTMEDGCSDPETMETKHLEDLGQLRTSSSDIYTSDTKSSIGNDSMLVLTKWHEDLHVNQSQQQDLPIEFPQSIPGPSSAASSEKIDTGTLTDDFLRPLLANLEDDLAFSQKKCYELQQQISQLKEQLRQSEEEKQNLQAELGKYLFLEGKEKRREKLLGGATPVQDPGFPLHARLLEISDSLSAEEVKRIKFLAKSKVSGFRLARFTEAFELFEELEMGGEFSCDYIGRLLAGIQRYDLVEKLGIYVPLPGAERGANHPPGQSTPDRKPELPDRASNSAKSMTTKDNSIDVPPDRRDKERHLSDGGNRNDHFSRTEETDYDCNPDASISSSGSSDETHHYTTEEQLTSGHMAVSHINAESSSSSLQSAINATKSNKLCNSSDSDFLSISSCSTTVSSSDSSVNSAHSTQAAALNSTIHASSDSTDGSSPMLTSVNSHSAFESDEISSDSGLTPTSSEEENLRSSQMLANGDEESKGRDVCDGAIRTAPSDSSSGGFGATQSGANVGNIPWSQQGAFPSAGMAAGGIHAPGAFNGAATNWERLGARPKQGRAQHSVTKEMPGEPYIPVSDGLAGDFLARHTQDKALHDSIYQSVGTEIPLLSDTQSQGASFTDGVINVSDSNKAKPYFGDCQAAYGTDPYSRLGISSGQFDGRGISYSEHLNNNTGPLPNHLGGNYFSVYGNYSQRNTLNPTNGSSLQSGFVHNNSRFSDHFGGAPHLPLETQQGPNPSVSSYQVLNSGVTGLSFADLAWNGNTVGTQSGLPVFGAQGHTSFNNNTSTLTSAGSTSTNFALGNHSGSITNNDNKPSASLTNSVHRDVQNSALPAAHAVSSCDPTRTTGLDSTTTSWPSLVCHSGNTTTVGDDVLAQGSATGTSIPDPSCVNADNSRASQLNNKDFGTDSVESTDNSLLALEQRVAEACALVERVLREREEREQFGREIERKEQLIREQRARERREREEREIREAERWPQQQEAITARSQWLCEHYQRHCRVRFPCCTQFYPCHRCHNISKACDNEEAKACHASHLKCSHCRHEQEIGEDSEKCCKCGGKMAAYFCSICKHFTSVDKNPYHCKKCGICRIHKDKSFHCEVCNVCLDKRLEGNHKCRPDSGHDECCICLEDAFSGCQILPCSHKVHRECAIAMIQNGIRTCPICRHPLYSQPRE